MPSPPTTPAPGSSYRVRYQDPESDASSTSSARAAAPSYSKSQTSYNISIVSLSTVLGPESTSSSLHFHTNLPHYPPSPLGIFQRICAWIRRFLRALLCCCAPTLPEQRLKSESVIDIFRSCSPKLRHAFECAITTINQSDASRELQETRIRDITYTHLTVLYQKTNRYTQEISKKFDTYAKRINTDTLPSKAIDSYRQIYVCLDRLAHNIGPKWVDAIRNELDFKEECGGDGLVTISAHKAYNTKEIIRLLKKISKEAIKKKFYIQETEENISLIKRHMTIIDFEKNRLERKKAKYDNWQRYLSDKQFLKKKIEAIKKIQNLSNGFEKAAGKSRKRLLYQELIEKLEKLEHCLADAYVLEGLSFIPPTLSSLSEQKFKVITHTILNFNARMRLA